jgi:exopolysaccharide biosynthesis polyprenyl glycosylphosphotransferase
MPLGETRYAAFEPVNVMQFRGSRAAAGALAASALGAVGDVAAVIGAFFIVADHTAVNILFVPLVITGFALSAPDRRRLSRDFLDDAPRVLMPLAAVLLSFAALTPFITLPSSLFDQAAVSAFGLLVWRALSYAAIGWVRRSGRLAELTAIVGAGTIGLELYRQLELHREYGLAPIGIIDDVPVADGLPLLGSLKDLGSVVDEYGLRHIIVAFGPTGEQDLISTLRAIASTDVDVYVVPRFFELGLVPQGSDTQLIWGIPIYRLHRANVRPLQWRTKRIIDVVLSAVALVALAPIMGLIALAVRLSSPGPVLFRQLRLGQHGRSIQILKFRTLQENLDSDTVWSVEDDPRQIGIGSWFRRLSLDELPQLWNVLRGDMSLVGPRPERPYFVSRFSAEIRGYDDRHRLPVGLTGLAQVHGLRGDTSIEERARFDNFYVEHWSIWQDVKILFRTLMVVAKDATHPPSTKAHPVHAGTLEHDLGSAVSALSAQGRAGPSLNGRGPNSGATPLGDSSPVDAPVEQDLGRPNY